MSQKTHIAWCHSTLNWWEGCTKVSVGCAHCYAEARDRRQMIEKVIHFGKGAPRRKSKSAVKDALAMNRRPWVCDHCGGFWSNNWDCCGESDFHRRRVFSLSLGDWLDPEVPIEWLAEMLDTIRQCDQLTWILCTKRPELWYGRIADAIDRVEGLQPEDDHDHDPHTPLGNWLNNWTGSQPPKNIILLTSVENQEQADKRIPELLKIPAACHGISAEPLLEDLDLSRWLRPPCELCDSGDPHHDTPHSYPLGWKPKLGWVIVGGESGPKARPCNVDWIRGIKDQCEAAKVACFVKQLGRNPIDCESANTIKHPKGADPAEWPVDLRVQQYPEGY